MIRRPHVNWRLARAASSLLGGKAPEVTRQEVVRTVAALRIAGRRAGELAVTYSRLPGGSAASVGVVDRDGWARFASRLAEYAITRLPFPERREGLARRASAVAHGLVAGGVLGVVGRGVLGQYDMYGDRLVLVAPTLLQMQRARRFDAEDFYLWVALHEQTHAVQFHAAPWLVNYVETLAAELAADDPGPVGRAVGVTERGVMGLLVTAEGQAKLERLTACMTLLEGHADYVADLAGADHVPTVRGLRRAFARPGAGTGWRRHVAGLDKSVQYRDGLAFCREAVRLAGRDALARAFEELEALPTPEEIRNPAAWVARVHGTA